MRPQQNHSNHPNLNPNKHGENYMEDESYDFELEESIILQIMNTKI